MNKYIFIFLILGLSFIVASPAPEAAWILPLVTQINTFRSEYKLPPVIYNYDLHHELIKIKNESEGIYYKYNPNFCMEFPFYRKNCNLGYSLRPLGNYALLHDTILKPPRINLVIKQRISQKRCLKSSCSGDHWITCFKNQSYENLFSESKCIYAHHYITKLLLKDLKSFACVILHYESGLSPIKQPYSFWCYSNSNWFSQNSSLIKVSKN